MSLISTPNFLDAKEASKYECVICFHTICKATMITNGLELDAGCGHFFCEDCINTHIDVKENCPTCRASSNLVLMPIPGIDRFIGDLEVKCKYDKCTWVNKYGLYGRDYEAHLKSCEFRGRPCIKCNEIVERDISMEMHDETCPKLLILCGHGCLELHLRDEMAHHMKDECRCRPAKCPYEHLGIAECKEVKVFRDLVEHEIKCAELHVKAFALKNDELMARITEAEEKEQELKTELEDERRRNYRVRNLRIMVGETVRYPCVTIKSFKDGDDVTLEVSECGDNVPMVWLFNGNYLRLKMDCIGNQYYVRIPKWDNPTMKLLIKILVPNDEFITKSKRIRSDV